MLYKCQHNRSIFVAEFYSSLDTGILNATERKDACDILEFSHVDNDTWQCIIIIPGYSTSTNLSAKNLIKNALNKVYEDSEDHKSTCILWHT